VFAARRRRPAKTKLDWFSTGNLSTRDDPDILDPLEPVEGGPPTLL
jgi:hypothetical protein